MTRITRRLVALVGAAALSTLAVAADDPPKGQTITAQGLSFEAPAAWKSSKPTSPIRLAQLAVDPVVGDTDKAELLVFAFPGGAGSVEANVQRWRGQFVDADGQPPRVNTSKRKGKNVDVTVVETGGRFVAPVQPGSPETNDKADYKLLGAIVETPSVSYFLKMVGPSKTMTEAKAGFDQIVASLSVEGK